MTISPTLVVPVHAHEVPLRPATVFPPEFTSCALGRERRPLGHAFGLSGLRVLLTRLAPSARAVLLHAHSRDDEFIYVLEGVATLHTDAVPVRLTAGMCAGLPAGTAHDVTNEGEVDVVLLEIGSRDPDDEVTYPEADLRAVPTSSGYLFTHKDGTPY
jgi:uncharacterized cupin superfamily protein